MEPFVSQGSPVVGLSEALILNRCLPSSDSVAIHEPVPHRQGFRLDKGMNVEGVWCGGMVEWLQYVRVRSRKKVEKKDGVVRVT